MHIAVRRIIVILCFVAVGTIFAWRWWNEQVAASQMVGIASANGRLEAVQVNVSAKEPGRIVEVLVNEGDLVQPGQVMARIDIETLSADLSKAKADLAEAESNATVAKSTIEKRESEYKLADLNYARQKDLFEKKISTKQDFDEAESDVKAKRAALEEERAKLETIAFSVKSATAVVQGIQTRIDDSTLTSPVLGRVLYKLAQPGEVLPSGGKVLTLLDLSDIYMEVFLPSQEVARIRIGADAKITLDALPGYSASARVSFVSPEAQFTPKQVETKSERDKLMFRVKIQVPHEKVLPYIDRIKTGVRGVGYVKLDDDVEWPPSLQKPFPPPRPAKPAE
ncbi:HlyD family secretion protein [Schlesneria sp. T3-172]|uniref:HlyD family secretion protein n=1 Tax=Schlesneria sphaerica TaxID=3373610 RepID=UPI0037C66843